MDFEPENPIPTNREREAIRVYFEAESEFMPAENFFKSDFNRLIRRYAVSVIARHSQGVDPDAFIPYLAMNYFDRFVSRIAVENVKLGDGIEEKVRLIAICCFTLAAKMRTKSFSVDEFRNDKFLNFSLETIKKMELLILQGLKWRMRSITAFSFLDHYYPIYKRMGGFKRRCINEIIVQCQGVTSFAHCKPSDIALCAFLAATLIAYPKKFPTIEKPARLDSCLHEMDYLCRKLNIEIEPPRLGRTSEEKVAVAGKTMPIMIPRKDLVKTEEGETSKEEVAAKTEEDKDEGGVVETPEGQGQGQESDRRNKGKEVVKEEAKPVSEIIAVSEFPKKLMNFELKWPIDVLSLPIAQPDEPTDETSLLSNHDLVTIREVERDRTICGCNIG